MNYIKCVAVGDAASEKTQLLISYSYNCFPGEYRPSVFDNYSRMTMFNGEPYNVCMWDSAGQAEFDYVRPLSYPQTDIFLVCFSVASPTSFESIKEKWVPEITHHCPKTPFLLVGNRIDLRDDAGTIEKLAKTNQKPITAEQGEQLARELKAAKYVECSGMTQEGVRNVFGQAIQATLKTYKKNKLQ